jgi:predicted pyridoxine 5'-phosphate oxidase superfamily flavin-nucleotide-binding protein
MREALDNAIAEGTVALVASAAADGEPDIAFKGSAMVWDADHLAFWERSRGQTLRNLEANPKVCVLYRSRERGVAWKFFGVADLFTEGDVREQIMARTNPIELGRDPERKGVAVRIRVDRVTAGPNVLMQRD